MRKSKTTPMAVAFRNAGLSARIVLAILITVGSYICATAMAADSHDATYSLDIPAQQLNSALQALAFASQHKLLYSSKLVDGRQSPALKGEYTTKEALGKLLAGTGLVYQVTADGLVVIRDVKSSIRLDSDRGDEGSLMIARADGEAPVQPNDGKSSLNSDLASGAELTEVIVTATKRAERLQDVPISISVLTADDIDRRGLVGAADYLRGIPGVNQTDFSPAQSIVIRGIETSSSFHNLNGGENTGTYFGETSTTGSAGLAGSNIDIKLVDIERVEVLRGPQGTAFGSSSMGGAVRTIPVEPKVDRFEGKVIAGYSATSGAGGSNYNLQGVANIPLVADKLAVRAVAYQYEDSGYYRNRAGSDPAFQAAVVIPQGAQAFAIDDDEVGSSKVIGGRIAALFQATEDLRFTIGYLKQKIETDGIPIATIRSYEQAVLRVAPEHVRRGQQLGLVDTDIEIANATMGYDFGWADLFATYSHVKGETEYMRPMTSIAILHARSQANESPHRGDIGELRLATKLDGAWNFLAGLYTERSDDEWQYDTIWFGNPAANPIVPGARLLATYLEQRAQKQDAVFGEVSWKFLERWTLTGGFRAFEYDQESQVDAGGPSFGGTQPPRLGDLEDSGSTFRANLNYKPTADGLVYAGWSQGYRLGRPQGQIPPAALCDVNGDGLFDETNIPLESVTSIDSDAVDSYEVGSKWALMDRRMSIDAALFRMDWTGMPANVRAPTCGWSYLANAGTARSKGVELQANLRFTDALSVDLGGSYVDARLTQDVPLQGFRDGDRLPSPRVNANLGVQYDFEISGHRVFVRADSIYVGDFYTGVSPAAVIQTSDYVRFDATTRLSIGSFNIDVFARNLTNEDAFVWHDAFVRPSVIGSVGTQLRPRTFGMQVSYNF